MSDSISVSSSTEIIDNDDLADSADTITTAIKVTELHSPREPSAVKGSGAVSPRLTQRAVPRRLAELDINTNNNDNNINKNITNNINTDTEDHTSRRLNIPGTSFIGNPIPNIGAPRSLDDSDDESLENAVNGNKAQTLPPRIYLNNMGHVNTMNDDIIPNQALSGAQLQSLHSQTMMTLNNDNNNGNNGVIYNQFQAQQPGRATLRAQASANVAAKKVQPPPKTSTVAAKPVAIKTLTLDF